jgi:hypothetical protein
VSNNPKHRKTTRAPRPFQVTKGNSRLSQQKPVRLRPLGLLRPESTDICEPGRTPISATSISAYTLSKGQHLFSRWNQVVREDPQHKYCRWTLSLIGFCPVARSGEPVPANGKWRSTSARTISAPDQSQANGFLPAADFRLKTINCRIQIRIVQFVNVGSKKLAYTSLLFFACLFVGEGHFRLLCHRFG